MQDFIIENGLTYLSEEFANELKRKLRMTPKDGFKHLYGRERVSLENVVRNSVVTVKKSSISDVTKEAIESFMRDGKRGSYNLLKTVSLDSILEELKSRGYGVVLTMSNN